MSLPQLDVMINSFSVLFNRFGAVNPQPPRSNFSPNETFGPSQNKQFIQSIQFVRVRVLHQTKQRLVICRHVSTHNNADLGTLSKLGYVSPVFYGFKAFV